MSLLASVPSSRGLWCMRWSLRITEIRKTMRVETQPLKPLFSALPECSHVSINFLSPFVSPQLPSCLSLEEKRKAPERTAPFPHPEFRETSSGFPTGTLSPWDRGAVPTASELQKVWLERCQDPQPQRVVTAGSRPWLSGCCADDFARLPGPAGRRGPHTKRAP